MIFPEQMLPQEADRLEQFMPSAISKISSISWLLRSSMVMRSLLGKIVSSHARVRTELGCNWATVT